MSFVESFFVIVLFFSAPRIITRNSIRETISGLLFQLYRLMSKSLLTNSLAFLVLLGISVPPGWVESCCCRFDCFEEQNESACNEKSESDSDCHRSTKKPSCCHQKKQPALAAESASPANAAKLSRGSCQCEKNQPWYWIPTLVNAKTKSNGSESKVVAIDSATIASRKSRNSTRLPGNGSRIESSSAQIALCVWRL